MINITGTCPQSGLHPSHAKLQENLVENPTHSVMKIHPTILYF